MTRSRNIIFLLLIFLSASAFAKIELIEWRPTPAGATLILPKRSNETAATAIRNYVKAFNGYPELIEINEGRLEADLGESSLYVDSLSEKSPAMLVSANDPFRMRGPRNQKNWFRMLESAGARVSVLPTVAGIALTKKEQAEFNRLLAKSFDGLLLLGGADVDPSLYKQENRSSKRTVLIRDQLEIEVARAFLKSSSSSAYGICRGMQLLAVALGCQMYQDIGSEIPEVDIDHTWDDHEMFFQGRSRLSSIFGHPKSVTINSVHHQAVRCENVDEKKLKILARDSFGIVEAIEFQDGKGFAVQYHPERLKGKEGAAVLALMTQMAQENRNQRLATCDKQLTGKKSRK